MEQFTILTNTSLVGHPNRGREIRQMSLVPKTNKRTSSADCSMDWNSQNIAFLCLSEPSGSIRHMESALSYYINASYRLQAAYPHGPPRTHIIISFSSVFARSVVPCVPWYTNFPGTNLINSRIWESNLIICQNSSAGGWGSLKN